jgi:hypothetical protein
MADREALALSGGGWDEIDDVGDNLIVPGLKIGTPTIAGAFSASALTANRAYAIPDEAGTLELSTTNRRLRTITCGFDGQGAPPTAGTKRYCVCPVAGTITGWRIVGDVSGSAVVDVWKVADGSSLPTVSNTIAASAKPTLSSAAIAKNDTLTGWTTTVTADDIFGFNVDSASTLTTITVELKLVV